MPGELTSPGLGLEAGERAALAAELDAVLHCAASISFSLPLDEARAINVDGTRRVIDLAREAPGLERFLHVSTAYVAGLRGGRFRERQLDAGQRFRNTYEQTKWESEHLVADAGDLAPCIVRPSIVVGESDSGWTPAFNVLYWPLRAFSRGLFDQVPARLEAHIDVVPVDYVADGIVHLLDRDDAGRAQPRLRRRARCAPTSSWTSPAGTSTASGRASWSPATRRARPPTSTAPSTCPTSTWT